MQLCAYCKSAGYTLHPTLGSLVYPSSAADGDSGGFMLWPETFSMFSEAINLYSTNSLVLLEFGDAAFILAPAQNMLLRRTSSYILDYVESLWFEPSAPFILHFFTEKVPVTSTCTGPPTYLLLKSTAQKTQISSPIWSLSPPGGKVTLC